MNYKHFSKSFLSLLILGMLVGLVACGSLLKPSSPFEEYATITGVITLDGKPVAGARVYAYEVSEFIEEEQANNARIEEILRAQVLEAEDIPVEEWPQEGNEDYESIEEDDDYPEYRGPADFKSALTGADGSYSFVVSPGRYTLVARKRANPKIQMGPLTPEDYSSLMSKPLDLEEGDTVQQDFRIQQLLAQTINFVKRYTIKTKETEIQGVMQDTNNHPLSGYYVTADRHLKVSHKPDFFSEPGNDKGEYTLYLPGGGIYYLALRRTPMGKTLPAKFLSEFANPADNSIEILEGEIITGIQVILTPQGENNQL